MPPQSRALAFAVILGWGMPASQVQAYDTQSGTMVPFDMVAYCNTASDDDMLGDLGSDTTTCLDRELLAYASFEQGYGTLDAKAHADCLAQATRGNSGSYAAYNQCAERTGSQQQADAQSAQDADDASWSLSIGRLLDMMGQRASASLR